MTLKDKFVFGAIVVVVAIVAVFGILKLTSGSTNFGAVGNMLAENYLPFIRINGGYNSAFPITTSGALSAGATTISGITTLTKPTFCINFYATSTATQLYMSASTTATLPNGAAAVMTANYGTCS